LASAAKQRPQEERRGPEVSRAKLWAVLTPKFVLGRYRLGSLLMALPGARGDLKQARSAWLTRCVGLCGTKDCVYSARDVFDQFEDPHDHKVRDLGATGEARAQAYRGTLAQLEKLIKDKKYYDADNRRLKRRHEAEAQESAARRPSATAGSHDALVPVAAPHDEAPQAVRKAEIANAEVRPIVEVERKPVVTMPDQSFQNYAAWELVESSGRDVKQAVTYLIETFWDKTEALAWLVGAVEEERENAPAPADTPWPPTIVCGQVPEPSDMQTGQYVTLDGSRVMVIDEVRGSAIVLADPLRPRGTDRVFLLRTRWRELQSPTEELVRSEFMRLGQGVPGEVQGTSDGAASSTPKKSAGGKKSCGRRQSTVSLAVAGA
jgi:hypothetical protein